MQPPSQNQKWGSGDPNQNLKDLTFAAYDDHRYIKWAYPTVTPTRAAYLSASCYDDRGGNWPFIVGEWSLSVNDDDQNSSEFGLGEPGAVGWYGQWWAAQVLAYEKQEGWIFWSWKANWINGENDWRWSYLGEFSFSVTFLFCLFSLPDTGICNGRLTRGIAAFQAGAIPKDPNQAYAMNPCNGVAVNGVEEHEQSVLWA